MVPKTEKSMVLVGPREMELREFEVPEIGPEEFLLKVDMVTVCGGDPIEYEGRNPKAHYPMILGHEMVGTIAQIGDEAREHYGVDVGDRVVVEPYIVCGKCRYCLTGYYQFCEDSQVYGVNISCETPPHLWGAYGEYLYGAPGSRVHKIAEGVPDEAATFASVLGNGVRWIRNKGEVQFGDTVVVMGVGSQGLATIIAANEANTELIIAVGHESLDLKWELAKEFGLDHKIHLDDVEDPVEAVSELTDGQMADVVVECTGAAPMMELALDMVRPTGRYILIGTCGFDKVPLTTDKIVFKELDVRGGLGQSWDTEHAVRIINSREYPIEKIVTDVFPLEEAQQALEHFMTSKDALGVAIKP